MSKMNDLAKKDVVSPEEVIEIFEDIMIGDGIGHKPLPIDSWEAKELLNRINSISLTLHQKKRLFDTVTAGLRWFLLKGDAGQKIEYSEVLIRIVKLF